jgi:ribosome maturation protein SDO1
MTQTIARIKKIGKNFEVIVDMENALAFKKTGAGIFLELDKVFYDSKKGLVASDSDLMKAFDTEDADEIAEKIVKGGEILVTQDFRTEEHEKKYNQVIDFIARNASDPRTGMPHTPDRIRSALEQAHVNIKNVPIENQIGDIMLEISKIIPIRIETKRIKIIIPAIQTGKAYGIISQYKEKENWLNDGSLEVIVKVPAGMIMDFYDKLNSATHGSAVTEEVKE